MNEGLKMTKRVQEILACYSGDAPGIRSNLARLLMNGKLGGTGRLVILPVDQGFEHVLHEALRQIRRAIILTTILN